MKQSLTLLELCTSLRDTLQDAYPDTIWVKAEISELKENRTGHCYLELIEKDEHSDEIIARMRATIWSYSWRMLRPYFESSTGQAFRQGIKVLVQASVEFHAAYGLSLNIKDIDPTYTMGDLVLRRREIIRKLEEAGILYMNKELDLPLVPQRIAVISSATAAGYQDFAEHLDRNPYGFYFRHELFEAYMQGSETITSIIGSLERIFNREEEFDAVVIIRGGGASADLNSFDHFDLASAVAQFPLPVITGIGHEKDDTIVDLVAHTRLKTPTAVAEFLIAGALRFSDLLMDKQARLKAAVEVRMENELEMLNDIAGSFSGSTGKYLLVENTRVQRAGQRLKHGVSKYVFRKSQELNHHRYRLSEKSSRAWQSRITYLRKKAFRLRMATKLLVEKSGILTDRYKTEIFRLAFSKTGSGRRQIKELEEKLRLLDPGQILQRGFTLTSQNGKILTSVSQISEDSDIETRFSDGMVISKPIKKKTYGNH